MNIKSKEQNYKYAVDEYVDEDGDIDADGDDDGEYDGPNMKYSRSPLKYFENVNLTAINKTTVCRGKMTILVPKKCILYFKTGPH